MVKLFQYQYHILDASLTKIFLLASNKYVYCQAGHAYCQAVHAYCQAGHGAAWDYEHLDPIKVAKSHGIMIQPFDNYSSKLC